MDEKNHQPTTMRLDYRATDRQTQPNAVLFGREEQVEYAFSAFRVDSRPGIFAADRHPIIAMLGAQTQHVWTSCDGGHGVECIRKQVQKHQLKLYGVGLDRRNSMAPDHWTG